MIQGHRVASGQAADNRYPRGTITMQKPFFKKLGLDLTSCHDGTLNVSILPLRFEMGEPRYTFHRLEWTSLHPPEDFSFSPCVITFHRTSHPGWIYYPHPETKKTHFQSPHVLEILAPFIPGIHYGEEVMIEIDPDEIHLYHP